MRSLKGSAVANWPQGAGFAGLAIIAMVPIARDYYPPWLFATLIQLPLYMLHQYEEWDDNRFGKFIDENIAHVQGALSKEFVFFVNVFVVWGAIIGSAFASLYFHKGFALVAGYLTLINGGLHLLGTIAMRKYNPGVITGVTLFLPLGLWAIIMHPPPGAQWFDHVFAAIVVIIGHLMIFGCLRMRLKKLRQ